MDPTGKYLYLNWLCVVTCRTERKEAFGTWDPRRSLYVGMYDEIQFPGTAPALASVSPSSPLVLFVCSFKCVE